MIGSHLRAHADREGGAVAVLFAIVLVLLFLIVGLAVDLGMARADVRDNQTVSDFAAMAGAAALDQGYVVGCQEALNYLYANTRELTPPPPPAARAACDSEFSALDSTGCDPLDPTVATIEDGPYTVLIQSPVPDNDRAMVFEGQSATPLDGDPCLRMKVTMARERAYVFGPVGGILRGTPTADAVALGYTVPDPTEPASLIVLERHACDVLTADGASAGSGIFVGTNPLTGTAGTIAVDSDGDGNSPVGTDCTSGNNRYTVDNSSATIRADGSINMHAVSVGNCGTAYPGCPANTDPKLGNELLGLPQRMTRSSVDWWVNCRSSYPTYATHHRFPLYENDVDPCGLLGEPGHDAYVDMAFEELQSGPLVGFHEIDVCSDSVSFDGNEGDPRRIHVSCANTSGPNPNDPTGVLEFRNVDVVVFSTRVSNTRLIVDGPEDTGALVYFRTAGVRQTTGAPSNNPIDPCQDPAIDGGENGVCLRNVFVYINSKGDTGNEQSNPSVTFNGGQLVWVGMELDSNRQKPDCVVTDGLPNAACFAPVTLWSNSVKSHSLAGGGFGKVSGSFFTPNAKISLSGGSGFNLVDAQFFARAIQASGGGRVDLVPNPGTNVPPPSQRAALIR